ncbi:MAG: dihydroneopterin aldolase [Nitrospirota bacterium]|nr:dihydroneopterin aldolase [Nitrospirota bacterium]MDH4361126.1 dihydroneopterin aldolase [Nitrospirota bacterium]MDH5575683.1 dihydroneopterin aldolase [Nitrospirota bacterium]
MLSSIVLKGIHLSARCGVTETERQHPQPLLVDLIFRCPNQPAFQSDQLSDTIDYGMVTQRVRDIGEGRAFSLIETLAESLCQTLFHEFPITHLKIWVRKIRPPLNKIKGSVGVQLIRSRQHIASPDIVQASPFLVSQLSRLPQGRILDVAAGRGRHAVYLASKGFSVHGIDRDANALRDLQTQTQQEGLSTLTTESIDLEVDPQHPPDFGTAAYDGIIVFFYLYRPLFPQIVKALKSGGILMYETFLLDNHIHRQHPRRKEFCLEANELLTLLQGLRILHYEEGDHEGPSGKERAFTARALAQKV